MIRTLIPNILPMFSCGYLRNDVTSGNREAVEIPALFKLLAARGAAHRGPTGWLQPAVKKTWHPLPETV
jgi:hypothetical protein